MDCDKYLELLSLRLDGELAQAEERELEAHLAVCPACRAVGAQLSALQDAFGDWEDAEVPEGFAQGVMGRIREEESRSKVIPLFRRPQFRALAGLAACLVLAVGLYGVSHPTDGGGAAPSAVETLQDAGPLAGSAPVERCMPELEDDAPLAAAYCAPEDGTQKGAPDSAGGYSLTAAPVVSPAVLTLDRMPEGAWELIPPETSVPSEGLLVTKELFEEIDRLAQEEEITASITTGWKDAEEFIIVVLEERK